jgi:hypothetical protein
VRIACLAAACFKTALNKCAQRNWLSTAAMFSLADEWRSMDVVAVDGDSLLFDETCAMSEQWT